MIPAKALAAMNAYIWGYLDVANKICKTMNDDEMDAYITMKREWDSKW